MSEIRDADIWVSDAPPVDASPDDFWFDTSAVPFTGINVKVNVPTGPPPELDTDVPGDAVISDDDGHMWLYDGSEWVDLGPFVGPVGPAGPPGPAITHFVGGEPDGVFDSPLPGSTSLLRPTLYFRGRTISVADDSDNAQTIIDVIDEMPAGGATGQVLVKTSDTDYEIGWGNPSIMVSNKAEIFEQDLIVDEAVEQFDIAHNFGSRWVAVTVYQASTGIAMECLITCLDENTVRIDLSGAEYGIYPTIINGRKVG